MDRYRDIVSLPLIKERLDHILRRINQNALFGNANTQAEYSRLYADLAKRMYKDQSLPFYDYPKFGAGYPFNRQDVNRTISNLYYEINYILSAVNGTGDLVESNYNFAIAQLRNLRAELKAVSRLLDIYSLYTRQLGDFLIYADTFTNSENIDHGSDFLAENECHINYSEGTVALPLKSQQQYTIQQASVGALSNGVLGNNLEPGVPVRGNIRALSDNNPDTWVEYERTALVEDNEGLRLELKIVLNDVQVVNGIIITPVSLGARTPPVIKALEVSSDGLEWISLKNDIRVAEFLGEDENYRFHLAPHTSRFEGEFNITFAPRFIKFIKIYIEQNSSFPIVDTYGLRRLRYAVGIKEVQIFGYEYETVGELISKEINLARPVSLALIEHLVDPPLITNQVGEVKHYLSVDDGASWNQLTAQSEAQQDIEEILEFAAVDKLRHKIRIEKNEDLFEQLVTRVTERITQVSPWSDRRPFNVDLTYKPMPNSLTVCDPGIGARGYLYPKVPLGNGVHSALVDNSDGDAKERHGNTQLRLRIPLDIQDPRDVSVYVSGNRWAKKDSVSSFNNMFAKQYVLERNSSDPNIWEVVFGNNDASSPLGAIPSSSDEVSMVLSKEYVALKGLQAPYRFKLDYPTDGDKNNVEIKFLNDIRNGLFSVDIPPGDTRYDLGYKNLYIDESGTPIYVVTVTLRNSDGSLKGRTSTYSMAAGITGTNFVKYKTFVDGSSELSDDGDWTVDLQNGVLYTKDPVDDTWDTSIVFYTEDAITLTKDDWDFVDGSLQEIEIKESGYYSSTYSKVDISSGITRYNTGKKGIVPKSVRLTGGFGDTPPFEIPFIDGRTEFSDIARIQDESVPERTPYTGSTARFRLTHWSDLISSSGFAFSTNNALSSQFSVEVEDFASLTSEGDYYIDTNGSGPDGKGYVYVVLESSLDSIDANTTVSYQYRDPDSEARLYGAYSVDLTRGIIYFAAATTEQFDLYLKHTPYEVRYYISNWLREDEDYELDAEAQTVKITTSSSSALGRNLHISYDYEPDRLDVRDLAPYFSPLLRAFALKVT